MVVVKESAREQKAPARPDLGREYRPIGIGAVAAALTVTSEKGSSENRRENENGETNEREPYWNSIAA